MKQSALAALVHDVVNRDDIGVGENPGALRLAHESTAELSELLVLGREADAEGLQGDLAADERVPRQVNDPHGALADLFEDLVAT